MLPPRHHAGSVSGPAASLSLTARKNPRLSLPSNARSEEIFPCQTDDRENSVREFVAKAKDSSPILSFSPIFVPANPMQFVLGNAAARLPG